MTLGSPGFRRPDPMRRLPLLPFFHPDGQAMMMQWLNDPEKALPALGTHRTEDVMPLSPPVD